MNSGEGQYRGIAPANVKPVDPDAIGHEAEGRVLGKRCQCTLRHTVGGDEGLASARQGMGERDQSAGDVCRENNNGEELQFRLTPVLIA
jgi:hypothetical protein